MRLSNFRMNKIERPRFETTKFYATVDVTSGFLWWKKTKERKIFRELGAAWSFADTGKFTPGYQAQELENAWKAQGAKVAP